MKPSSKMKAEISKRRRFEQIVTTLYKYKALRHMTPVKLRMILEDLGPTYVKLGQIMSSRTDLLPSEYTRELEKLRSQVAPMPYAMVKEEIETAYGKPIEEVFASFDSNPLGSASMAQVHKAMTRDGRPVVVKVQRPHVYEQMEVDVEMMKKAGKLLSLNQVISSIVNVEDIIDEFWQSAREEMDFHHEAENARRFASNNQGIGYLHPLVVYDEFTRDNILVMEEVDGMEIDDYAALAQKGYSRSEIARKLGTNYIKQVVKDGYFHGDPHSGNLKIQDGKIVWLDFGMMGELSANESAALAQALQALASRDLSALCEAVLMIGQAPDDLDYVGFSNAMERYLNHYLSMSFSQMDMAEMAAEAIEICHKYRIRLPKGITMLARSMVTLQGTLKDLDAEVNLLDYVVDTRQTIDQIDWQKVARQALQMMAADGKALLNLPLKADHVLGQLERGQLRIGLHLTDLQQLTPSFNHSLDRLVLSILIAALLIGSSIVCTTSMRPRFLDIPLLGFIGYFISFCLSLWLFYKMIFHPHKGKRLF